MKIYVNWESEKIVRTEIEARNYMISNGICDNFNEYLTNELDFSAEEIFNLHEDKKARICEGYVRYLNEVLQDCWEIVEIQPKGTQVPFDALIY